MVVVINIFLALFALGAVLTWKAWPQHHEVGVARRLAILWVGIFLAMFVVVGATATSTGLFAFVVFRWLAGSLSGIGIPEPLAGAFAALAAVPVAIAIAFAFSFRRWQRYVGVTILFAIVAAFSFARYAYEDIGYAILPNGRVQRCWTPGEMDRGSGQPCVAMTPAIRQFLDQSPSLIGLLFVEEPAAFFDPATNAPLVWYCERADGSIKFALLPIFDPMTGKQCQPVTKEIAERVGSARAESTPSPTGTGTITVSTSPITVPFREDYADGDYRALNVRGNLSLESCGTRRCLCGVGTGPWTMDLKISPIPFYAASVSVEVHGEGWQLAIAYMNGAEELLRATHNWRVDGAASSCVGKQCMAPVALGVEWHRVLFVSKWRVGSHETGSVHTEDGWKPIISWFVSIPAATLSATAMATGATMKLASVSYPNDPKDEASAILVTIRQPYETKFCIGTVEVRPVAKSAP